jgi:hypothetical protein
VARSSATARRKRGGARDEAKPLPSAIRLRHKPSGKERSVATGFAWDLFLFAGIFGLPLFWRRLPYWGAGILVLWLLVLIAGALRLGAAAAETTQLALFAAFLIVQIGLGFYGNRLTAKTLLHHGWTLEQANDAGTRRLIEKWKLA